MHVSPRTSTAPVHKATWDVSPWSSRGPNSMHQTQQLTGAWGSWRSPRKKLCLLHLCQQLGRTPKQSKLRPAQELGFKGLEGTATLMPVRSELYASFLDTLANKTPKKTLRGVESIDSSMPLDRSFRRHDRSRFIPTQGSRRPRHKRALTAEEAAILALKKKKARCSLDMDAHIRKACLQFDVDLNSVPENVSLLRDSSIRLRNAFKQI